MTGPRRIAVIDIGKTNAKLALVDLETLSEIAVVTRPNIVQAGPPWPHFDTEGHWAFLMANLAAFHRIHGVDAISITTHGACFALLGQDGGLAAPILDYEHPVPADIAAAYDRLRPDFAQTGSPRLAAGLNVGAQLHFQFTTDPTLRDRTASIVGYPQYWAHRLTGIAANDVTSIGCHTDLWLPEKGALSGLAATLGIAGKLAPVRKSADVLGPILPAIAAATGLAGDTPVICGIHDSNASLYPHLLTQPGPFAVVSTGTWVVVMAIGARHIVLDPRRDTLINVNARGQAVPSARFMGGREFEIIQQDHAFDVTDAAMTRVLMDQIMLLPAVVPQTGPFPGQQMRWQGAAPEGSAVRSVALSFYLALMTATCLRLTGAQGPTIVEGPFARNIPYLSMLSAATGEVVCQTRSVTGTSIGAALLFGQTVPDQADAVARPVQQAELYRRYADNWGMQAAAPGFLRSM